MPRRLSKKAIVALVVAAPLFAAAALWAIARTQSNEGPEVKVTQALRRRSVAEVAPAISAPPVARPAPPIEVTPAPATSAPVDTNRAAPARRTRAYPVVKAPPHSPQKGTSLPASGLANDPIAKDKLGDPGIVDPWR